MVEYLFSPLTLIRVCAEDELDQLNETRAKDALSVVHIDADPVKLMSAVEVSEGGDGTLYVSDRVKGVEFLFVVPGVLVEVLLPRAHALKR